MITCEIVAVLSTIGEGVWFQSYCMRNIVNAYVLWLLITAISRFAIVRKSDINWHVNEFIMSAVLQIYIKFTINRSILSKIIPLIVRFIPLIKRCPCHLTTRVALMFNRQLFFLLCIHCIHCFWQTKFEHKMVRSFPGCGSHFNVY